MDTQTNCKAVQNRVRNLRKNLLPVLLAVAGLLAGSSEGRATNYAAIDFGIGYNRFGIRNSEIRSEGIIE